MDFGGLAFCQLFATNTVNSKVVTIPKKELTYGEWHGSGYIVMDIETMAAGYMISGGLAGGSTSVSIDIMMIGIIDVLISLFYVFEVAIALEACTIPLVGLLLAGLTILCFYSAIHTLEILFQYWITGDHEYASELMTKFVMDITFMALFSVLEPFLPGIVQMLKNLAGQMKGVAEIASRFGQDIANLAARYGDDCINAINKYGLEFVNMIKKYSNCIDDVLTAIKRGIKPAEIEALDELGIQPNEFERLHITSEGAAESVAEATIQLGDELVRAERAALEGATVSEEADLLLELEAKTISATEGALEPVLAKRITKAINSSNPGVRLEGEIADALGGKVINFQKNINGPGGRIGEIDIETDSCIIDCFIGTTSKEPSTFFKYFNEMAQYMNPEGKQVILYSPNIDATKVAGIEGLGVKVIRTLEELKSIVGVN